MKTKKILFLLAGGGFLEEIRQLSSHFTGREMDLYYVTADHSLYAVNGLEKEKCYFITQTTSISEKNKVNQFLALYKSFYDSYNILNKIKPDYIISVGTSMSVPFFVLSRKSTKCIFIESLTRVSELSLTGKVIYHLSQYNRFYVQWPQLIEKYKKSIYKGNLL